MLNSKMRSLNAILRQISGVVAEMNSGELNEVGIYRRKSALLGLMSQLGNTAFVIVDILDDEVKEAADGNEE